MFEELSRSTLEELSRSTLDRPQDEARPHLSLYLPTHRYGPEAEADRSQLKNLLRQAEELLARQGFAAAEADKLLASGRKLIDDPAVWKQLSDGLAIFLAPGKRLLIRAAVSFAPEVTVNRRFRLAPLLPALPGVERFYVLGLSINAVRVIEVTPAEVRRLEVPEMPIDMDDALGYDQYYSEVQVHSAGPRGLGRQPAIVHGHGDGDEERFERDLVAYFRRVAECLQAVAVRGQPVVLAAVEEYFPLFRKASGALEPVAGVAGNPEPLSDQELVAVARRRLDESAKERIAAALGRFRELANRRRASDDAEEIVDAAYHGRVDTLFFRPDRGWWGSYEPDLCRVEGHQDRQPGDDDLVDLAVTRTLAQGGEVWALPADESLGGGPLTAILRYSTAPRTGSA